MMKSNSYMTVDGTIYAIDKRIHEAFKQYDAALQPTTVIAGVRPRKRSKNKFIQWILIKLFGYEIEYKTVMAKTIVIKAEDCPTALSGEFTFTIGEELTQ